MLGKAQNLQRARRQCKSGSQETWRAVRSSTPKTVMHSLASKRERSRQL